MEDSVLDFTGEGAFCRMRLDFEPGAVDQAPEELRGASLFAGGTLGDGTSFALISNNDMRIERRSDTPFNPRDIDSRISLAFDVGEWLNGVDFSTAEIESGGSVTIDSTHNRDVLDAIEQRIETAIDLYGDHDGDGTPTPAERITGE